MSVEVTLLGKHLVTLVTLKEENTIIFELKCNTNATLAFLKGLNSE